MATVAIIGGGVSGLFLSCFLKGRGWEVHLYEKTRKVGGNCATARVRVESLYRWADLGVNDFNQPMYQDVYNLMQALGIETPLLEDTSSFFTRDASTEYTIDGGFKTPMPASFTSQFERFRDNATQVLNDPQYTELTVREFFAKQGYTDDFLRQCILPRINAMYFSDDTAVDQMPIQAVLHYYVLQEGFGTTQPVQRRYFRNGTSMWIHRLKEASGAQIFTHQKDLRVCVQPTSGNPRVRHAGIERAYDCVVFACHANQALKAIDWGSVGPNPEITGMLGRIKYVDSTGYVHKWPGVLPRNPRAWRTYNVLIRDYQTEVNTPYSISYVLNHHQADAFNPFEDYYKTSPYFVTLNPFTPIPPEEILRDEDTKQDSWKFPHNVVNFDCLRSQQELWRDKAPLQGQHGLYFTGGWTLGAGLHIECWESARQVADLLSGRKSSSSEMTHDPERGTERSAPEYIRRLTLR